MLIKNTSINCVDQSKLLSEIDKKTTRLAQLNRVDLDLSNIKISIDDMRAVAFASINRSKAIFNKTGDYKEIITVKSKTIIFVFIISICKALKIKNKESKIKKEVKKEAKEEIKKMLWSYSKLYYIKYIFKLYKVEKIKIH